MALSVKRMVKIKLPIGFLVICLIIGLSLFIKINNKSLNIIEMSLKSYSLSPVDATTNTVADSEINFQVGDNFSPQDNFVIDYIVISETPIPTPTRRPTATPTQNPITIAELESLFAKYSSLQSIDRELLKKIAYCESKYRVGAVNGPYVGLYQFSTSAWIATRKKMNLDPNPDLRFNAEEAIKTAAFKIAIGGVGAWPNCK